MPKIELKRPIDFLGEGGARRSLKPGIHEISDKDMDDLFIVDLVLSGEIVVLEEVKEDVEENPEPEKEQNQEEAPVEELSEKPEEPEEVEAPKPEKKVSRGRKHI